MNTKHSMAIDLRTGKEWRVLCRFSVPIIFSYLLQQAYSLSDAVICGKALNADEFAGVSDVSPLIFIFLQFAFGCTAGFSVITSIYVGNHDEKQVRRSFASQILLGFGIGLFLTLVAVLLLNPLLALLGVTPENKGVYDAAYRYCFIIFLGILAQLFYNLICSVLRSLGDSVTPLIFLLISTVLNILLDLLLIVFFRCGVTGAAIATVLAQALSAVACFVYAYSRYPSLRIRWGDFRSEASFHIQHLRQGLPLAFQFSVLAIGIIVMQSKVIDFDLYETGQMVPGNPAQNAYGAANKILGFLMCPLNAFGTALVSFNAQNYGAGNYDRIRRGMISAIVITLLMSLALSGIGFLFTVNAAYQHCFLSADKITEESIRFGNLYLYVDFGCLIFLGFLFIFRSGVQGIGKSGFTLLAGIAELISRMAVCLFLPDLLNGGKVFAGATDAAVIALSAADPAAWLLANLALLYPVIRYIFHRKLQ